MTMSARPPSVRRQTQGPSVAGSQAGARAHRTRDDTAQTVGAARPPASPSNRAPIPASLGQHRAQRPLAVAHDRLAVNPARIRMFGRQPARQHSARRGIGAPRRGRLCPAARRRSPSRPHLRSTQTLRWMRRSPLHIRWRPPGWPRHERRRRSMTGSCAQRIARCAASRTGSLVTRSTPRLPPAQSRARPTPPPPSDHRSHSPSCETCPELYRRPAGYPHLQSGGRPPSAPG